MREEIEASGLYRDVEVRRHFWDVEYGPDEYVEVLGTYSVNLALRRPSAKSCSRESMRASRRRAT